MSTRKELAFCLEGYFRITQQNQNDAISIASFNVLLWLSTRLTHVQLFSANCFLHLAQRFLFRNQISTYCTCWSSKKLEWTFMLFHLQPRKSPTYNPICLRRLRQDSKLQDRLNYTGIPCLKSKLNEYNRNKKSLFYLNKLCVSLGERNETVLHTIFILAERNKFHCGRICTRVA